MKEGANEDSVDGEVKSSKTDDGVDGKFFLSRLGVMVVLGILVRK